jgi:aminopeptidase N
MSGVEGADIIGGGMEFPMMTLIGDYNRSSDSALYYVTAHEFAHMWVPMVVNVDERRHAWMDEGTTSFNENQARKEFFPGYNHDLPDQQSYLSIARAEREGEMMRWTDFHYDGMARGIAGYSKVTSPPGRTTTRSRGTSSTPSREKPA